MPGSRTREPILSYSRGEPADGAYIVSRGSLELDFGESRTHKMTANNIVVGTLELFLSDAEERVFDLALYSSSKVVKIDKPTVHEMLAGFRFGYNTNIFLAQLLELSNELYIESEKRNAKFLKEYRRRSEILVKMVDVLFEIAERYHLPDVDNIAAAYHELEMYHDGSAYRRPSTIHAVLSPPTARSKFIELFKKNALVCREGGMGKKMYVLLEGKISVSAGGSYVTTIEQAGEAFGEMSLFLGGRRTATLVAEEDSHLYVVEHKNIRQFVKHKSPTLFLCIAEALSKRIWQNIYRFRRLNTMAGNARVVIETGLKPAERELLGKAELSSLLKAVRAYHAEKPASVLKTYIEQYSKQVSSSRL